MNHVSNSNKSLIVSDCTLLKIPSQICLIPSQNLTWDFKVRDIYYDENNKMKFEKKMGLWVRNGILHLQKGLLVTIFQKNL